MLQRIKVLPLCIEFLGSATVAMALFSMSGRTTFPFFGALVAGIVYGLFVLIAWPLYRAQVNPIVTIGMWSQRLLGTKRAIATLVAQMLGGVAAWQLSEYLVGQTLRNIAGDTLEWNVVIAEAVGAAVFAFIVSLAVKNTASSATRAFAAGAGLAVGMIVASLGSNGIINPAAAIGLQSWSWAYVLGPIMGALVGMNLLSILVAIDNRPVRSKAAVATKAKSVTKKSAKKVTKKK